MVRQTTLDLHLLGRPDMQFFSMNYLMTMRYLPQLDRKVVACAVVCTLAIAAAVTWIFS